MKCRPIPGHGKHWVSWSWYVCLCTSSTILSSLCLTIRRTKTTLLQSKRSKLRCEQSRTTIHCGFGWERHTGKQDVILLPSRPLNTPLNSTRPIGFHSSLLLKQSKESGFTVKPLRSSRRSRSRDPRSSAYNRPWPWLFLSWAPQSWRRGSFRERSLLSCPASRTH